MTAVIGVRDAEDCCRTVGVGHGSYRTSGPCVDTAVDRYLIDGTVPADGTTCVQPAATTIPGP